MAFRLAMGFRLPMATIVLHPCKETAPAFIRKGGNYLTVNHFGTNNCRFKLPIMKTHNAAMFIDWEMEC
jgi:hypothetical protein